MPKFTVAIVGAGISGLGFAIALQTFAPDIEYELYDGASELAQIGAGIGVQPRGWSVLKAMGLEDSLLKIAGDGERPTLSVIRRKSDQLVGMDLHKDNLSGDHFTFHRGDLQRVLLEHLRPPHAVRLGKRVVSYTQLGDGESGQVELRFQDGTTAVCDVLVGCDGVRSSVRAAMYTRLAAAAQAEGRAEEAGELRACAPPVFSGAVVYRCLIRREALPEESLVHAAFNQPHLMVYCGKDMHLVTYPIAQGRVLNVGVGVSVPEQDGAVYDGSTAAPASREEIVKHFSVWEPDVHAIVKHIEGGVRWTVSVVKDLPTFVDGRVAIIGDAAHAMLHHLGSGAGQSFEDGFFLAQFLGHANVRKDNVNKALIVFDEIRRPFTQKICAFSRRMGELHHFNGPDMSELTAEKSASGNGLTQEDVWKVGDEMEELKQWREDALGAVNEAAGALHRLDGL